MDGGSVRAVGSAGEDFYGWALCQADRIRRRRIDTVDFDGLACAIEAMALREHRLARRLVRRVLARMLLCEYTEGATGRWMGEAAVALHRLASMWTPSLVATLRAEEAALYRGARSEAVVRLIECGGDPAALPKDCPFRWEEIFGTSARLPV